jgi:hypothetical protein
MTDPRDAAALRKAIRQRTLTGGRVKSFEAFENIDEAQWAEASIAERFQAVIELVRDSWYLAGNDGPPPRLDRSVGGVRKLGR